MTEMETITPEQAQVELEGLLSGDMVDDMGFARGNFCMAMLGCPIKVSGKPAVLSAQDGAEARDLWNVFQPQREALNERYQNWRETVAFGE